MRFRRILAFVVICLFCFPFRALASATPSDAEENPIYGYIEELLKEIDYDDLDDYEKLELLDLYISGLSGPGVASASDADLGLLISDVSAIRDFLVPAEAEEVEQEDLLVDEPSGIDLYDAGGFNLDRNVIIYVGTWQGSGVRLVLPSASADTLWIDDSGRLYNVGTSNIVGRIYYGSTADLKSYDQYVFTLTPALNGNASTIYSYGSPNYCRHYYRSGSNITSTATYGDFTVTEVVNTPSDVPARVNGYYLLALIMIGGVQILCLLKKSRS